MNEKERQIISHLRKDARTSLASISYNIEMPISTIYDKINRLNKSDVIRRFTALIDFSKLGFHYQAKLALRVEHLKKEELLLFLREHESVNSLYEINGGFDFFVETIHKDIKEYLDFVNKLKEKFELLAMQEFQIIDEIEREKFV